MGKVMNIIWHSRTLKHCKRGESSDNSYSRTNQGVCLILLRTDCGNRNFSTIFTEHRPAIFPVYRHSRTNYKFKVTLHMYLLTNRVSKNCCSLWEDCFKSNFFLNHLSCHHKLIYSHTLRQILRFNVDEILNSRFPLLSQPQYVLIEWVEGPYGWIFCSGSWRTYLSSFGPYFPVWSNQTLSISILSCDH